MGNLKKLLTILMLFSILSVFTVPAFAASPAPKPGNGFGDVNHQHTGPPGQSNRPSDHVQASFNLVVEAEGTAKSVVEAISGILRTIHFG